MAVGVGLAGYAFGVEPMLRMGITRYRVTPPNWPRGFRLTLAVLADIHACEPWMSARRVEMIAHTTNALGADAIILLGDYRASHRFTTKQVDPDDWASALAKLDAPHGTHAILGNHDWWDDSIAQSRRSGPVFAQQALHKVGIPVYENDLVRLQKNGHGFWLAGLGDQLAFRPRQEWPGEGFTGIDDLSGTLAKVDDDAPVILLAHEPDIFPKVPERVSLTLSGHTHGGQVRVFGFSPVVPSQYGNRFAYGHIVEGGIERPEVDRHLIVSGGLGCSILPVRFGVPPEIVLVEIGAA